MPGMRYQPQAGPLTIQRSWLSRRLKLALVPAAGYFNSVLGGQVVQQSGPLTRSTSTVGLMVEPGTRAEFGATIDPTKGFTLISIWCAKVNGNYFGSDGLPVLVSTRNASNQGWSWGHSTALGGASNGNLIPQTITFQGIAQYTEQNATIEAFVDTPVACRYDPATGLISWFRFGEKSSPDTAAPSPSAGAGLVVGAQGDFSGNGAPWPHRYGCALVFESALTDAEIRALTKTARSPFQVSQAPEEDDFVAAAGGTTGTSATTDGADTSSGSGSVSISGASVKTDGADISAAFGAVAISGSSASIDGADISSASGSVSSAAISGTSATTDGADVSTASGGVAIRGSAASTDGSDSTAATGGVSISGASAANDGADLSVGVGAVAISGTSATVDAADISSASGTVTTGVTGSSSTTDGADVSAASGGVAVSGSIAVTDGADVSTAYGAVAVSGTSATTDGQDVSSANGSVATGVSGSANTADGADVVSAFGTVAIAGSAAANDGADISSASGSVGVSVVSSALMPNPYQTYIGNTRIRTYSAQTRVRSL